MKYKNMYWDKNFPNHKWYGIRVFDTYEEAKETGNNATEGTNDLFTVVVWDENGRNNWQSTPTWK